jgi:hypothetical protein
MNLFKAYDIHKHIEESRDGPTQVIIPPFNGDSEPILLENLCSENRIFGYYYSQAHKPREDFSVKECISQSDFNKYLVKNSLEQLEKAP